MRNDGISISIGKTASIAYTKENGVAPVEDRIEIR